MSGDAKGLDAPPKAAVEGERWRGWLVEAGLGLAVVGWLGWLAAHPGPVPAAPSAPEPPATAAVRAPRPLVGGLDRLPDAPALPAWAWHRAPMLVLRVHPGCCLPSRPLEPQAEVFDAGPGGLGIRVRADEDREWQLVRRHEVWRRDADEPGSAWERVHLVEPGTSFEWVDRRTGWLRRWEYRVVSVVQLDPEHPQVRRTPAVGQAVPELEPRTFEQLLPARRAEREVSVAALLLHEAAGGAPRVDLRVRRWDPAAKEFRQRTFLAVGEGQAVGKPPRAGEGTLDFTTGATVLRIETEAVTLRWADGTEETLPIPAR